MLTAIRGLRGQRHLRVDVVKQMKDLLERGRAAQRLRRVEGVAAWLDSNRGDTRGRAA
jgi:hypothetical protein